LPARSRQALQTIEIEYRAAEHLPGLHAQKAYPDELALIVAAMYGAALRGFCSAIAKALGVHHA
jgi:hypothetical protein